MPKHLTMPDTATAFSLRLCLHYKAARASGVMQDEMKMKLWIILMLSLVIISCDRGSKFSLSFSTDEAKGNTELSYYGDVLEQACFNSTVTSNELFINQKVIENGYEFLYQEIPISVINGPDQLSLKLNSKKMEPIKASVLAKEIISGLNSKCG